MTEIRISTRWFTFIWAWPWTLVWIWAPDAPDAPVVVPESEPPLPDDEFSADAMIDVYVGFEDEEGEGALEHLMEHFGPLNVVLTSTPGAIGGLIRTLTRLRDTTDPEEHFHLNIGEGPVIEDAYAHLTLFREDPSWFTDPEEEASDAEPLVGEKHHRPPYLRLVHSRPKEPEPPKD